ncbi:MAG: adenosylcobinamide-GDP ribazoletransferase [Lachnospiraceae bacterium]|nr:adenosylcobinamide-GDP ribazoletransferase [Lachnospiraceae bacterium]
MSAWIDGFFMSWGMFCAIPCPLKRWNEEARGRMLACFPLLGLLFGILWAAAAWLLEQAGCPMMIRGMLLACCPWLLSGFIHLDGYMDVCDAVLSRRDLNRRQQILKDSHCGAFAVICMVLLGMAQWSLFAEGRDIEFISLAMIPVAARSCSAMATMKLRPMAGSQYAAMKKTAGAEKLLPVICGLVSAVLPLLLCGMKGTAPLAAAAAYALAARHAFVQLDGFSGDAAGFSLTISELAGAAALVLIG